MITPDQARSLVDDFENQRKVKFDKLMAKHAVKLEESISKIIEERAKKGYVSVSVPNVASTFLEDRWFSWRFDPELLSERITYYAKVGGFELRDGQNIYGDPIKRIYWG